MTKFLKSCKTQFGGIFDHFLAFYAQNEFFPNNSAVMQNPTQTPDIMSYIRENVRGNSTQTFTWTLNHVTFFATARGITLISAYCFLCYLMFWDKNDTELSFKIVIILQTQQRISLTHLAHTTQDNWDTIENSFYLNTMLPWQTQKNLVKIQLPFISSW